LIYACILINFYNLTWRWDFKMKAGGRQAQSSCCNLEKQWVPSGLHLQKDDIREPGIMLSLVQSCLFVLLIIFLIGKCNDLMELGRSFPCLYNLSYLLPTNCEIGAC
jgi:hypothetical protein